MRSNYKQLGPYIREVDVRNTAGKEENLLGVSTQKVFIVSIANTVGTDFSKYKVVKRGQFTYVPDTSRRGDKIGLAMLDHLDEGIVSSAYTVFEIINHNDLLPEYLMMWFRRPEFDRYARYMSHGSVREIFGWEEMCHVELPIPSLEKQKEIVAEYNTLVSRIKLNEELNRKLEETAQAIYKRWFVDFEFPNENGKPYNSSGGEMVWNDILEKEIPKNWSKTTLGEICDLVTKGTTPKAMYNQADSGLVKFIKGESISEFHTINENTLSYVDMETHNSLLKRSKLMKGDILFSIAGTLGKFALVDDCIIPANTNQAVAIIRISKNEEQKTYIIGLLLSGLQTEFFNKNIQQAVQANFSLTTIKALPILLPERTTLNLLANNISPLINTLQFYNVETRALRNLSAMLLSKLAIVETTA
jgi:type I restriction enzyme S subunit